MPQASIDPVVMAAATVMRLQTIVSREIAATDAAVVTVGVLQAGTKENVIPDEALIKLNVRTFDAAVRKHVLEAIKRIANAEAAASGAPRPPEITPLDSYPLNVNDKAASDRVRDALRRHFGADRVHHTGPAPASEDFGCFGTAWDVPSVFWFVGGTDPEVYAKAKAEGRINELPVNHSPSFAPVIHPTLADGRRGDRRRRARLAREMNYGEASFRGDSANSRSMASSPLSVISTKKRRASLVGSPASPAVHLQSLEPAQCGRCGHAGGEAQAGHGFAPSCEMSIVEFEQHVPGRVRRTAPHETSLASSRETWRSIGPAGRSHPAHRPSRRSFIRRASVSSSTFRCSARTCQLTSSSVPISPAIDQRPSPRRKPYPRSPERRWLGWR